MSSCHSCFIAVQFRKKGENQLKRSLSAFAALNCTQFLGAMNDNIFKLLTVFCFISIEGAEASYRILSTVGVLYVIPFLFLSATAGTMADRFSKRTIIVLTKVAECCVMFLGVVSFLHKDKFLAYLALFLLACHSAIFAPCKYGIVPEIVPLQQISKANGFLTSSTFSAIIVGTFLASFLVDITSHNFVLAASVSCLFALIGLYTAFKIPKTAPAGSNRPISFHFVRELARNIPLIYKQPSLLTAVFGSAFFLLIGSYTQLNMIPYALESLRLTDVQGGYLFLITALGIGCGSLIVGKLSGRHVELGFVPLGGLGISCCLILLGTFSSNIYGVLFIVFMVGVFGGIYLVPLDSYIQFASPNAFRGQVIATGNFFAFFGVFLSASILYFFSEVLGLSPAKGFFVMGCVTLFVIAVITYAISGYVCRFFVSLLMRLAKKSRIQGSESISLSTPAVFYSDLFFIPWGFYLLGSQNRRMHFFVMKKKRWEWLRLLPGISYAISEEALFTYSEQMQRCIERGTSIAIFCPKAYFGTLQIKAPIYLITQKDVVRLTAVF
jgi:acyl-[acyl-carrier-protein]-phospholipid O-acyltransferase/long-chain-fatty-acid--[acyl-carrier-protein] ligase